MRIRGLMAGHSSHSRAGFRYLAIALALLAATVIATYAARNAVERSTAQAAVTRQVVEKTNALLSATINAETGQRGFLLTGREMYLKPWQSALTDIPALLDDLTRLESESSQREQESIRQLRVLTKEKLDELTSTIDLRRRLGLEAALPVVLSDRGKAFMDEIREICDRIERSNTGLADDLAGRARSAGRLAGFIAVIGGGGAFILLLLASDAIRRGSRQREELIGALTVQEARARESRDWLQTTLASIGDCVITTDAMGRITLLNPVAESVTGWTNAEASGKPLEQVFVIANAETGIPVENPVRKVLSEGRIVGLANHTRLTTKDGREIPIDDSAAPIRDGDGNVAGVVLVFRDITAREKTEHEIQKNAAALRQTNAALLRANEDLNHFAFAASHDLQEPLRMIAAYSQLLMRNYKGQADEQASLSMRFINEGTERMRQLLTDLLAYTQVIGHGDETVTSVVDLNLAFAGAVKNCEASIHETQADVTSAPLPSVPGYEPHFVQVFQNLISNALKYRGDQPPRVHVSAARESGEWRISVTDNGLGIEPEYHQKIFGVFKRLHSHAIPGTGIGLAICQRVVERYGGRIWVESKRDHGATFHFSLPEAEAARTMTDASFVN